MKKAAWLKCRSASASSLISWSTALQRRKSSSTRTRVGLLAPKVRKSASGMPRANEFKFVKWLPAPNAPVFLKSTADFQPTSRAVGHFPGTDYPVSIKSIDELVTHNTAILGILGIGKSMLAIELVERMMAAGIKTICVDLTNQYLTELALYIDAANASTAVTELQGIMRAGKTEIVRQNVEEGGSRAEFAAAMGAKIREFMNPANPSRLMILNPTIRGLATRQ